MHSYDEGAHRLQTRDGCLAVGKSDSQLFSKIFPLTGYFCSQMCLVSNGPNFGGTKPITLVEVAPM